MAPAAARSPASLAAITNVLKLDTNDVGERQLLVSAMVRLMQTGAYDQAHALYLRAKGAEAGGERVDSLLYLSLGYFRSS